VELRRRLGLATRIFDTEFIQEKLHAQNVLAMMKAHLKKKDAEEANLE
jgi:hypothetical protein